MGHLQPIAGREEQGMTPWRRTGESFSLRGADRLGRLDPAAPFFHGVDFSHCQSTLEPLSCPSCTHRMTRPTSL